MNQIELQDLYCKWCPHDCQGLTDEERHGCLASGGFADDYFNSFQGELISDEEIDALYPTEDEIQSFLAEPTPNDEANQSIDKILTESQKYRVAVSVVHCRKVAKAQAIHSEARCQRRVEGILRKIEEQYRHTACGRRGYRIIGIHFSEKEWQQFKKQELG